MDCASRRARLVLPTPIGPSTTMNFCGIALTSSRALFLQDGNTAAVHARLEIHDTAVSRNHQSRGDIRERIQDEVALRHSGVGQPQAGLVNDFTMHPNEIEVDDAGTPTLLPAASHGPLDRKQSVKQ